VMAAVRNQEVAVRRPVARRMPNRRVGRRRAVRRSSQEAKRSKTADTQGVRGDNDIAGPSQVRWGVVTVNVRRGPAFDNSNAFATPNTFYGLAGSFTGKAIKLRKVQFGMSGANVPESMRCGVCGSAYFNGGRCVMCGSMDED